MTMVRFRVAVEVRRSVQDFLAGLLVEVAGRLVGQEQLGLGDQGPGDGGPLHLAAGELARLVRQAVAEADHVEQFLGPLGVLAACCRQ